jgi:hypothetical protein
MARDDLVFEILQLLVQPARRAELLFDGLLDPIDVVPDARVWGVAGNDGIRVVCSYPRVSRSASAFISSAVFIDFTLLVVENSQWHRCRRVGDGSSPDPGD